MTLHKKVSQDESLFYAHVTSGAVWHLTLRKISPFSYGRVTSPQNRLNQPFCWLLSKILFYTFYGDLPELLAVNRRLYPPTSVLITKDSFPNFLWWKSIVLALKGMANHLALSSSSISSGHATRVTWIPFSVQPILGHGGQGALAFILTWIRSVLGTFWFKHRRVGELTSLSPSVAYHVTIQNSSVSNNSVQHKYAV